MRAAKSMKSPSSQRLKNNERVLSHETEMVKEGLQGK